MNVGELKEFLSTIPDEWKIVIADEEGNKHHEFGDGIYYGEFTEEGPHGNRSIARHREFEEGERPANCDEWDVPEIREEDRNAIVIYPGYNWVDDITKGDTL